MEEKSALVIRLRKDFVDWLGAQEGIRRCQHHSEEDLVWLIPKTSSFNNAEEFDDYLKSLQPLILQAELERFGINATACATAAKSFEEIVDVEVRDDVCIAPVGGLASKA